MANTHPQEQLLYARIKNENITIDHFVWDTLYLYLGDYISAINFISSYYVDKNEPISVVDARKILGYTRTMTGIVDKILHHEKMANENHRLETIRDSRMVMHPVIRELISHYVSNDVQGINFVVSFHLDPLGEEPIPIENARKILNYTLSLSAFLDKLRKATQRDVGF